MQRFGRRRSALSILGAPTPDRNGWQPSRGFQLAGAAPTQASAASAAPFNVGNTRGPVAGGLAIAAGYGYAAPSWIALVLWWKDSHP